MKQNDIVQSVDRALTILDVLSDGEMSLNDIKNKADLNKSTAHRLLQTLIYKGFVTQTSQDGHYALTTKLIQIGQKLVEDMDIIELAKPVMNHLSEATGEVIHLVVIDGKEAVYIDKIESKGSIRMYSYVGKRIPLFSSAVGKAYMAFSDQEEVDLIWEDLIQNLKKFTEKTLHTEEALKRDLIDVRKRGYAIDDEENEMGIICVAAPIYNHRGKIQYALSVSTPKFKMDFNRLEKFGRLVQEAGENISEMLGYKNA